MAQISMTQEQKLGELKRVIESKNTDQIQKYIQLSTPNPIKQHMKVYLVITSSTTKVMVSIKSKLILVMTTSLDIHD